MLITKVLQWVPRTQTSTAGKKQLLRVIDVHRNRLLQNTFDCRYTALSYVWGQRSILEANLANIGLLAKPEGLSDGAKTTPIAQTIRDVIELTRNIGEKYLRVDSLCIVQDDPKDKHSQISAMDQVYDNAVLTIIAAGGDHADSGLAGVRPSSRIEKQITVRVTPEIELILPLQAHGFRLDTST
ncbi:hypothetical protein MMC25_004106 [Agyrium rufum]|nr:hypothetical protein [Agyrium rufum]